VQPWGRGGAGCLILVYLSSLHGAFRLLRRDLFLLLFLLQTTVFHGEDIVDILVSERELPEKRVF